MPILATILAQHKLHINTFHKSYLAIKPKQFGLYVHLTNVSINV